MEEREVKISALIKEAVEKLIAERQLLAPNERVAIDVCLITSQPQVLVNVRQVSPSRHGKRGWWRAQPTGQEIVDEDWQSLLSLPLMESNRAAIQRIRIEGRSLSLGSIRHEYINNWLSSHKAPYRIKWKEGAGYYLVHVI